jgi:hypothetical protein
LRLLALLTRFALRLSTFVGAHRAMLQFVLGGVALILGFWGWSIREPVQNWSGLLNNCFRTLQLITLNFPTDFDDAVPWPLQVARLLVPLIAVSATFHILLGGVTRPLRLALLPHARDHVVLIGDAQFSQVALTDLAAGGRQVVAVAKNFDAARRETLEGLGLTALEAAPRQPATFQARTLRRAGALFVAGPDDLENINLALLAIRALDKRPPNPPLTLAVKIDREDLAGELAAALDGIARRHGVRYHRLCPDRDGLRIELARFAPAFTKPDRAAPSHALVVGLQGRWEQALGQIILSLQDHPTARPNVTLALSEAEQQAFETWRAAHPDLDLIAQFRRLGFPAREEAASKIVAACGPPHLAVILLDGADAIAAALALRRPACAFATGATPILVRQSKEDFLLAALRGAEIKDRDHNNLIAFSGPIRSETVARVVDRKGDEAAMALHAHYLEGSARLPPGSPAALAAWDDLPENLREANRASADHMAILFASEGIALADTENVARAVSDPAALERLAQVEHRRWMADRIARGWRSGVKSDDARLIRASIKPYSQLPETEKEKDRQAVRVLAWILRQIGVCSRGAEAGKVR